MLERQVQAVAKLRCVRRATATELETWFPGVRAADRWKYAVELYWVRSLPAPFNLRSALGMKEKRYRTVQGFAMFDDGDDLSVVMHLAKTNAEILLDIVNNADPEADAS